METNNSKLNELLKVKVETASKEHLVMLTEELRKSQLILPVEITSKIDLENAEVGEVRELDEPLRFKPIHLTDDFGNELIPLFSDDSQVKEASSCMVMYCEDLANTFKSSPEGIDGVVFNPFGENPIMLPMDTFVNMFSNE